MFLFRKIWHVLFSWNTRFEIRPFALLSTIGKSQHTDNQSAGSGPFLSWWYYNRCSSTENVLRIIHLVHAQNFPKKTISHSLICTPTCAYQGARNVCFSGSAVHLLNGWSHMKFIGRKSMFSDAKSIYGILGSQWKLTSVIYLTDSGNWLQSVTWVTGKTDFNLNSSFS